MQKSRDLSPGMKSHNKTGKSHMYGQIWGDIGVEQGGLPNFTHWDTRILTAWSRGTYPENMLQHWSS